jgi:hypothetical protein
VASEVGGSTPALGGVVEDLVEVDVLVELLELIGARRSDRLPERIGERTRAASVLGVGDITPA